MTRKLIMKDLKTSGGGEIVEFTYNLPVTNTLECAKMLICLHAGPTNTFRSLFDKDVLNNKLYQDGVFLSWHKKWRARLIQNKRPIEVSLNLMRKTNPLVIPRNHKVEEALGAASNGNLVPTHNLLQVLKNPYKDKPEMVDYQSPPDLGKQMYKTFCGT